MSSRPQIAPSQIKPLINAASMATTISGPASIIQNLPGISYQCIWTGSPVGVFSVQVSNSYSQNSDGSIANAGVWDTLPSSAFVGTYPVPSGTPGQGTLDIVGTEVYAVRLLYTPTSGTGTLTVYPCAKVF